MRRRWLGLAAVLFACGEDTAATPVSSATSIFVVPGSLTELAGKTFLDHPFPSDLRRADDGTAVFDGWPNPFESPLLASYVKATSHLLDGFSPIAPIYVRFTGPIDVATLPANPPAALAETASVRLLDLDHGGEAHLIQTRWQERGGVDSYYEPNTLAVMPMLGRPLRPKTRYALVVTDALKTKGGGTIARSADLNEALGLSAPTARTEKARALFAPVLVKVPAARIVHLTVFTTNDPTSELFAVANDVKSFTAPTASGWSAKEEAASYDVYEGSYGPNPNYQAGTVPYEKTGGAFSLTVQNEFDVRFAMAVPKCPMPAAGYPIVLYAHGTGGDYRSFLQDGTGAALAEKCLAAIGVDQIFHGTRPGADPSDPSRTEQLFFNFDNPIAGRSNNRQSAIDVVQEARLFETSKASVPSSVSRTGQAITFDPTRILFFGHSQGGLNGPLYLAASNSSRGGVLSGAGAVLSIALLDKKKPVDVSGLVRALLGLSDPEIGKELDLFHPALTLVQSIVDVADPIHYGSFITASAKSIFQTEGDGDTYSPPRGIEALALSMSLPRLLPGTRPIPEAGWAGIPDVSAPLSGNLAGGRATGALAQFAPPAGKDGHFVVFNVPEARARAAAFCQSLAVDPVGKIDP